MQDINTTETGVEGGDTLLPSQFVCKPKTALKKKAY